MAAFPSNSAAGCGTVVASPTELVEIHGDPPTGCRTALDCDGRKGTCDGLLEGQWRWSAAAQQVNEGGHLGAVTLVLAPSGHPTCLPVGVQHYLPEVIQDG